MREMYEILHEAGWRTVVGDLLGMVALCVVLYALTVLGAGLQP